MALTDIVMFESDIVEPVTSISIGNIGQVIDQVSSTGVNELTLTYEFSFGF